VITVFKGNNSSTGGAGKVMMVTAENITQLYAVFPACINFSDDANVFKELYGSIDS
jgi:hypothetical protein